MNRLRVLIVDTSILYRKMMDAAILSMVPKAVVHHAVTAKEALEKLASGNYQMVILDTSIDDVMQLVSQTRQRYPHIHLILMGRNGKADQGIVADALKMGAHAYMVKPIHEDYETNLQAVHNFLSSFIQTLSQEEDATTTCSKSPTSTGKLASAIDKSAVDMIVIAASTGGPSAMKEILSGVRCGSCPPVLIVQHMPAAFTRSLAESLGSKSIMAVKEAEEDDLPLSGHVYIAPGGQHMIIKPNGHIGLTETAFVNGVRPSADVLFESVADVYKGGNIVAVILTGMGRDGALGVQKLKERCNCYCIAQSRESCVVFGMPREVVERGLADSEEDLQTISESISKLCDKGIADDES